LSYGPLFGEAFIPSRRSKGNSPAMGCRGNVEKLCLTDA